MTTSNIDALFKEFDSFYPNSPVRARSKTVGAWVMQAGVFHFSLTKRKRHVHLSDVWVAPNRRGHHAGKCGMINITSALNRHGVACIIDVRGSDGGMGTRRLKKWYERFGFIAFQRNGARMGRVPQ